MKRIHPVIALLAMVFMTNAHADIAIGDYSGSNFNTSWPVAGATGSGYRCAKINNRIENKGANS